MKRIASPTACKVRLATYRSTLNENTVKTPERNGHLFVCETDTSVCVNLSARTLTLNGPGLSVNIWTRRNGGKACLTLDVFNCIGRGQFVVKYTVVLITINIPDKCIASLFYSIGLGSIEVRGPVDEFLSVGHCFPRENGRT